METVETERTRKHTAYCKTKPMLKRTLPILFLVLVRAHTTRRILSFYVSRLSSALQDADRVITRTAVHKICVGYQAVAVWVPTRLDYFGETTFILSRVAYPLITFWGPKKDRGQSQIHAQVEAPRRPS